jgi:hypothetical protein
MPGINQGLKVPEEKGYPARKIRLLYFVFLTPDVLTCGLAVLGLSISSRSEKGPVPARSRALYLELGTLAINHQVHYALRFHQD